MTNKIETIGRAGGTALLDELMEIIKPFAEERGLAVNAGRWSYDRDGSRVEYKLEFGVMGENGAPAIFNRAAELLGLPAGLWQKEVTFPSGMVGQIINLEPGSVRPVHFKLVKNAPRRRLKVGSTRATDVATIHTALRAMDASA